MCTHIAHDVKEARVIAIPAEASGLQLQLSQDGRFLTAGAGWESMNGGSYYLLDLADPDAEWIQGSVESMVSFVEMSGN